MTQTIYLGSIVHSISLQELQHVEHAILCVGEDGTIAWVEHAKPEELQDVALKHGVDLANVEIVELDPEEFLCPGLIDTHTVSCLLYDVLAELIRSMRRSIPISDSDTVYRYSDGSRSSRSRARRRSKT